MLVGSLAGGLILSACQPDADEKKKSGETSDGLYGRTEKEKAHDLKVMGETFGTKTVLYHSSPFAFSRKYRVKNPKTKGIPR